MKKRAMRKDFYMEIRRSTGRFLSILFIVAMGVAFFSGIRSAEPSMRITGDSYYDKAGLMDIRAVSTMGITAGDLKALEAIDGVDLAEGAYSADFLCKEEKEQYVLHVMSAPKTMNQITVTTGRMPQKTGECLVDDEMGYQVGDTIQLESGTEDPVADTLRTDKLKVVGTGNSPCYISFGRGSTTIGTGSIDGFLIVPESSFCLEVFTEACVRVSGAKNEIAYTDAYAQKVDAVMEKVKDITGERAALRRQEVVSDAEEELSDAREELEEGKEEAQQKLSDAEKQLVDGENKLADGRQKLADGRTGITGAKQTLRSKQKELDRGKAQYTEGKQQLEEGEISYEQGAADYEQKKASATAQITSGRQTMEALQMQIVQDQQGYESVLEQLVALPDDTVATEEQKEQKKKLQTLAEQLAGKIAAEEQAYAETTAALDEAEKNLTEGAQQLATVKSQLAASETELANAYAQLQSGQTQIDAGWSEIKKQEAALSSAEKELKENETKLADARQEYEDGKADADAEIADGEKKIADAEKEIQDIKNPKWYVYDRGNLPEYDGYGENADRMRAIGKVFPVIFFLVAALISLTSMTRMVEEQRVQIGTMKALGYGKFSIASKYLGYALLASVGGSIFGFLVGEKVLPYIIIYAYGIMYHHIPEILVPYDWMYASIASAAAIACTMSATFAASYHELSEVPASLMRPPSPKNGRRVFLERIRVLWSHMNFTWKSTVRNLMRYKKRFFMTIFGIGGCMALMLVGFGLKDSIFEIAGLQYGEIQNYDGSIYLQEDLTEDDRNSLNDFLSGDADIERFLDAYMKNMTLENGKKKREAYICVFADKEQADQYVTFRDRRTKESYRLTDQGAIISEKTAKLLNVRVGENITIRDGNNETKSVKIAEICENYMGHYLYFTPDYYKEVFGDAPEYNSIFFAAKKGYSESQIKKAGQEILEQEQVLSMGYLQDIQKQLDDMLGSLNLVIVVLIVSAGMLAFVVLYNLNNINITERQRELATLKVLGFYNPEVAAYVYRENVILTVIGAIAGAGLGRILHLFIIQTVEVDAAMFGRNINFPSYVYSLLFTLLFSMVVNGVMFFKLKKIDMVESLKSIE